MAMRERMEQQGNWIFRHRSYLPLGLIVIIIIAMRDYSYLYNDAKIDQLWVAFCLLIALTGLAIRIWTVGYVPKGTSGRNTRAQVADVLNTTGIYSIVRNPLYVGNFFIWFAAGLVTREWWVSAFIIGVFYFYHERIVFAEEEFLCKKFGEEFLKWAEATPAFIPNFKLWVPANMEFSIKSVIKRECHGFFGIIATFSLLDALANYSVKGIFKLNLIWNIVFGTSVAVYLIILLLVRYTAILDVQDR